MLPAEVLDAILHIDVLEHLHDHLEEVVRATQRLQPGRRLIVPGSAHRWLFRPLDEAVGHYLRYDRTTPHVLMPAKVVVMGSFHRDSARPFASLANWLIMRLCVPSRV